MTQLRAKELILPCTDPYDHTIPCDVWRLLARRNVVVDSKAVLGRKNTWIFTLSNSLCFDVPVFNFHPSFGAWSMISKVPHSISTKATPSRVESLLPAFRNLLRIPALQFPVDLLASQAQEEIHSFCRRNMLADPLSEGSLPCFPRFVGISLPNTPLVDSCMRTSCVRQSYTRARKYLPYHRSPRSP